jgi:methyl-accepting chemotaxis protein
MEDIRNDNQASLQEIMALGAKSKQISKIMSLITNLADQTKLIAFNAALEASSAGEAGKRFSVVASEIRRLADSVTDSTDEIEAKINEIQDAISRLVITSEKGANGILAGTAASNNTAERFNDIVSAVNQTSTTAQQISLSTQQQKIASSQVVFALREIVGASAHTATAITKVAQISNEMTHISEQLSQATQFFKLGAED